MRAVSQEMGRQINSGYVYGVCELLYIEEEASSPRFGSDIDSFHFQ